MPFIIFLKYLFIYLFGCTGSSLRHAGTSLPCAGSLSQHAGSSVAACGNF